MYGANKHPYVPVCMCFDIYGESEMCGLCIVYVKEKQGDRERVRKKRNSVCVCIYGKNNFLWVYK